MRTIHKYPLDLVTTQAVRMPAGAIILHTGLDPQGQLCVWAQVDTAKPTEPTPVWVIGTGQTIPKEALIHIASAVVGRSVWHVYAG